MTLSNILLKSTMLSLFLLLLAVGVQAQQITIQGTVTDAQTGDPLIGVNILVMGTSNGTVTDKDGHYSLTVSSQHDKLRFSYIGFKTKVVSIDERTTINVALKPQVISGQQMVVVGYEKRKKRNVTGAISTIDPQKMMVMSGTPDIGHMLEGKIPGLFIRQTSAQPGGGLKMIVRGGGSINASNKPLIVIDGMPITKTTQPETGGVYNAGSFSVLNFVNPNNVESITVLKGPSATAIYGSRAANGVILITTKKGNKGKPVVQYSGNYSYQPYNYNSFDVLSLSQWMKVFNQAAWEHWLWVNHVKPWGPYTIEQAKKDPVAGQYHPYYSQKAIKNVGRGTNWIRQITRDGITMQHNLSVSGGSESVTYFLSGNYYNQKGVVRNSGFKRISFRANTGIDLSESLSLRSSLYLSRVSIKNSQLGNKKFEKSGILTAALQMGPHIRAKDRYGNYPINPQLATQPNPLSMLTITDKGRVNNILFNTSLLIEPTNHLMVKLKGGLERGESKRWQYIPRTVTRGALRNGIAYINAIDNSHYLLQATVNYENSFLGIHNVDILLGTSTESFINQGNSQSASNFITDAFKMYNMGTGTSSKAMDSFRSEKTLASYFGRLNYNYKNKYYVTLTMRADGSSVFAKGHKWGFFPSASVAWDVSQESFFEPLADEISQLKLRVSYGQVGNAAIGTNAFASFYAHPAYISGDGQIVIGVSPERLGNPQLTWETTKELNIGLDYSLFKGRISGSFDYYHKVVGDLLSTRELMSYQPISTVVANIGATQSRGFGFVLTSVNISQENFVWRTRVNVSRFYTTWKKHGPGWKAPVYVGKQAPINAVYSHLAYGIMQKGEEPPEAQPELLPGQIKIKDINGFVRDENGHRVVGDNGRFLLTGKPDGKIDNADVVMIGNGAPSLIGGLVNIMSYKNFTFKFSFNAKFGRNMTDPNFMRFGRNAYDIYQSGYNRLVSVLDRWTPSNPSTTQASTYQAWSPYGSGNFYMQDAWFIRLQDVVLKYELPNQWFSGAFTQAGIHIAAHNLFTITPYTGVDPETDVYAAAIPI